MIAMQLCSNDYVTTGPFSGQVCFLVYDCQRVLNLCKARCEALLSLIWFRKNNFYEISVYTQSYSLLSRLSRLDSESL